MQKANVLILPLCLLIFIPTVSSVACYECNANRSSFFDRCNAEIKDINDMVVRDWYFNYTFSEVEIKICNISGAFCYNMVSIFTVYQMPKIRTQRLCAVESDICEKFVSENRTYQMTWADKIEDYLLYPKAEFYQYIHCERCDSDFCNGKLVPPDKYSLYPLFVTGETGYDEYTTSRMYFTGITGWGREEKENWIEKKLQQQAAHCPIIKTNG